MLKNCPCARQYCRKGKSNGQRSTNSGDSELNFEQPFTWFTVWVAGMHIKSKYHHHLHLRFHLTSSFWTKRVRRFSFQWLYCFWIISVTPWFIIRDHFGEWNRVFLVSFLRITAYLYESIILIRSEKSQHKLRSHFCRS